jgi:hypothetical protein
MRVLGCLFLLFVALTGAAKAQNPNQIFEPFTYTADSIIRINNRVYDLRIPEQVTLAMYDVISGPMGARDTYALRRLFWWDASLQYIYRGGKSVPRTIRWTADQYIPIVAKMGKQSDFYEKQTWSKTLQFRQQAVVWSAFEIRTKSPDGPAERTGINTYNLIFDKGRWHITHIQWDSNDQGDTTPIPPPAN